MNRPIRIGMAGYAALLKTIAHGKGLATWRTLAEVNGVSRGTAALFVYAMNDFGIIRICGWATPGVNGRSLTPCYELGDAPGVPHPNARRRANKRTKSSELLAFATAVKALQDEPHHGKSLHEVCGIWPRTCRHLMYALHDAKLAYIAEYDDRGSAGNGAPMYAFGVNCEDLDRPDPRSDAEINAARKKRTATAKIMRGVVTGFNGDKRTAPYRQRQELEVTA